MQRLKGRNMIHVGLVALIVLLASSLTWAAEITWWTPNWTEPYNEILARKFEEENPDIKVNIQTTVAQGLENKILIALRSGSPPDVVDVALGWNIPFALTGEVLALDDFIAESGLDVDDFLEAAWATTMVDGKVYGIPYRSEAHALIYNKAMFREAGLDPERPPQTWDELVEYAKKLTRVRADGRQQYGFGIAGGGEVSNLIYRALPFVWMNGGSMLSDDYSRATINQPAAVEGVKFYTDFYTEHKVAPPSTLQNDGAALRDLFVAEVLAMYTSGQYDIEAIQEANPDIELGFGLIPYSEGGTTTALLGGWNFMIPKKASNPEAAWRFVEFMTRPENMALYTNTFPARYSALELPEFQTPELAAFAQMLPYAKATPPVENWIQITQLFYNATQEVLLGRRTVESSMDNLARQIDRLLAR